MKIKSCLFLFALIGATAIASHAQAGAYKHFVGRWDMTLNSPTQKYPSWLEITVQNGQPSAMYVGRWGSARTLPRIEIKGDHITFVSPKEEEATKADMVFDGELNGKRMSGSITGPEGAEWSWFAVPAPASDAHPRNPHDISNWSMPVQLFNGSDLTGWHMSASGPSAWTIEEGLLISPGNGPELITDRKFQDFTLHLEFWLGTESNSGVYLRGRYEVQLETDSIAEPASHHTGGIYGFIAPSPEQPREANDWQSMDITLLGRYVTVVQNGITVIDNQEIPGITGGALDSDESKPGPIYLQGSEKGHVKFRNIIITTVQ